MNINLNKNIIIYITILTKNVKSINKLSLNMMQKLELPNVNKVYQIYTMKIEPNSIQKILIKVTI